MIFGDDKCIAVSGYGPGVIEETPFFYFTCFDSGYWNVFLTWERWLTQPLLDKKLNTLKLHANVTWMETASLCWATQITMKLIMVFYKATQYDVDCLVLIDITLMIKCMKVSMYVAIWLFFCMHAVRNNISCISVKIDWGAGERNIFKAKTNLMTTCIV